MDQRILLICHDYHPTASANTLCLDPIVKHLTARGISVDWVCVRSSLRSKRREEVGGVVAHRVLSLPELLYRFSRTLLGAHGRVRPLAGKVLTVAMGRLFGHQLEGYVSSWRRPATRRARRLIKSQQYSAMVSVSVPVTAHLIALELKELFPELPWLIYQLDPFAFNYILPPKGRAERKALESKFTSGADVVVAARGILEENESQGFLPAGPIHRISLELPILMVEPDRPAASSNTQPKDSTAFFADKINLVYAGAFYGNGVRPADGIIELIQSMPKDFAFHVLGGSADVELRRLQQPRSRLQVYGRLGAQVSDLYIDQADILLSVGNNLPNQMPSKLFRYMSSGKAIVHLQYHQNDLCVDLLRQYGRTLIVPAAELGNPTWIEEVAGFCRDQNRLPGLSSSEIHMRMRGVTSQEVVPAFEAALRVSMQGGV